MSVQRLDSPSPTGCGAPLPRNDFRAHFRARSDFHALANRLESALRAKDIGDVRNTLVFTESALGIGVPGGAALVAKR